MQLPQYVNFALEQLDRAGYEAFAVGGCVRDSLLGRVPQDYDITTAALPEQTEQVFQGFRVVETGLKHGTVTVILQEHPVEITTYRVESGYSDGRHPDSVIFTKNIEEDLSRRDFTVNAMAYSPKKGLIDPFGGRADLQSRIIRCVGEPERRFGEDALRILRALRFASVLGFSVEPKTADAVKKCSSLLSCVSAERIFSELTKLLCGDSAGEILRCYPEVIGEVIPEILPMVGFDQHNFHHIYDVWQHTAKAVESIDPRPVLRWAALLHDVGKPSCFTLAGDGVGHFYGHDKKSAQMADTILKRLKADNDTRLTVTELVRRHDAVIEPNAAAVRRALHKMGEERFHQLVKLQRADNLALNPQYFYRQADYDRLEALAAQILAEAQCFSLKHLAVNGNDLMKAGYPAGPELGKRLSLLLQAVMEEKVPNEKEALLRYCQKIEKP